MSKTITIEDDIYQLLRSLKQGGGDSFTKVLRRHIYRPAETCGELLEATEKAGRPEIDPALVDRFQKERGRRSGGRK